MAENLEVKNHDVAGLVRRINRILVEFLRANSANVSGMDEHDLRRARSYLKSLIAYLDWVQAQPALDLGEHHPTLIALEAGPEVTLVENEELNDLVAMLVAARNEIANCEDARKANGVGAIAGDKVRAVIAKAEKFVNDYVDGVTPLDLSKSSPRRERAVAGERGV